MHLTSVQLRRFRNIESLDWEPAPGLNLICGENGQGKTNVLEAIHLALAGRSFRTRREEECLPWDAPEDPARPTQAQATLRRASSSPRLRVLLGRGWKRASIDGRLIQRLGDYMSEGAVVTFAPEGAGLFKAGPGERRRFLDQLLAQFSATYLYDLKRYSHALRQLHALLRRPGEDLRILESARPYFPILAESGAALTVARRGWLNEAGAGVSARHAALGGEGTLDLAYEPGSREADAPDEPAGHRYRDRLEAEFAAMRRQGVCTIGPHRDDFTLRLAGRDLKRFGSQGQHRLCSLALRLESARRLERARGEAPILLLDDFGSELDASRRAAVLEELRGSFQTFITATSPSDLGPERLFEQALKIESGKLLAVD